jgi:hypothetical protein
MLKEIYNMTQGAKKSLWNPHKKNPAKSPFGWRHKKQGQNERKTR